MGFRVEVEDRLPEGLRVLDFSELGDQLSDLFQDPPIELVRDAFAAVVVIIAVVRDARPGMPQAETQELSVQANGIASILIRESLLWKRQTAKRRHQELNVEPGAPFLAHPEVRKTER